MRLGRPGTASRIVPNSASNGSDSFSASWNPPLDAYSEVWGAVPLPSRQYSHHDCIDMCVNTCRTRSCSRGACGQAPSSSRSLAFRQFFCGLPSLRRVVSSFGAHSWLSVGIQHVGGASSPNRLRGLQRCFSGLPADSGTSFVVSVSTSRTIPFICGLSVAISRSEFCQITNFVCAPPSICLRGG